VGLIVSVTITMFLKQILDLRFVESSVNIDWYGVIILGILALITVLYTKFRKKALSPILLIVISGILGMIFY
jgi:TctA family transporter